MPNGVRDGDTMSILIFFAMLLLMIYWISGLSGISPTGNSTVSAKFNNVYNLEAKPFISMLIGLSAFLIVKQFTRLGEKKQVAKEGA